MEDRRSVFTVCCRNVVNILLGVEHECNYEVCPTQSGRYSEHRDLSRAAHLDFWLRDESHVVKGAWCPGQPGGICS